MVAHVVGNLFSSFFKLNTNGHTHPKIKNTFVSVQLHRVLSWRRKRRKKVSLFESLSCFLVFTGVQPKTADILLASSQKPFTGIQPKNMRLFTGVHPKLRLLTGAQPKTVRFFTGVQPKYCETFYLCPAKKKKKKKKLDFLLAPTYISGFIAYLPLSSND